MAFVCYHCFVSGRVQGVFYRQSTQTKAKALGLVGWVRNLPDGRVELMACGEKTDVQILLNWLWKGPIAAEVTHVESSAAPVRVFSDFRVL